jgi:hypothetical protein
MKLEKIIKIILAVGFFICLLNMPYGYYEFIRFSSLLGFGLLAFKANEKGYRNEMLMYIVLAMLFQPFFKLALGRTLWNIIDVLVGSGLLITLFKNNKEIAVKS